MDLGDGYPLVNQHNYGKSPFLMGKSTISMAIFNSYVKLPEGILKCFMFHDDATNSRRDPERIYTCRLKAPYHHLTNRQSLLQSERSGNMKSCHRLPRKKWRSQFISPHGLLNTSNDQPLVGRYPNELTHTTCKSLWLIIYIILYNYI